MEYDDKQLARFIAIQRESFANEAAISAAAIVAYQEKVAALEKELADMKAKKKK